MTHRWPAPRRWLLTGIFPDVRRAERAYKVCVRRGYEIGSVNVVMSEATRRALLAEDRPARERTREPRRRKAANWAGRPAAAPAS